MKKLLVILLLIPSLVFGAYTEFYCQTSGSNLNAGSTTNNTAAYTSTNGNWSTTTRIFTPTDGSTPASTVSVGDWVSIYNDGSTVSAFAAQVTAVGAGVNGTITVSATSRFGSQPSTSATARSLKAGGAWKGPNGTDASPFSWGSLGANVDGTTGNQVRVNMKNNGTFSLSSGQNFFGGTVPPVVQGYTTTPGDGGKATLDAVTTAALITSTTSAFHFVDMIFSTSVTSGTPTLISVTGATSFQRCVFTGARSAAVTLAGGSGLLYRFVECEFASNNKSNSSPQGAITLNNNTPTIIVDRCYFHDNTGSSGHCISVNVNSALIDVRNSVFDSNGGSGIFFSTGSNAILSVNNCDFYNNGGDGITNTVSTTATWVFVTNSNFVKNTGKGINITKTQFVGLTYNNGYGSGTQANGSADALGGINSGGGDITYGSGLTPWNAPTTGDFRIALAAANWAGRGVFTETLNSKSGTVGFPDIGAAQSKTGSGGTFSKEVSAGYSH